MAAFKKDIFWKCILSWNLPRKFQEISLPLTHFTDIMQANRYLIYSSYYARSTNFRNIYLGLCYRFNKYELLIFKQVRTYFL